jgi:Peptidase MA superfamily
MPHLPRHLLTAVISLALLNACVQASTDSDCKCSCSAAGCICYKSGPWCIAETENFQACTTDSEKTAKQLAETAEELRGQLREKWLAESAETGERASWTPKCQIVLHPNQQSYVAAVGRGSEHTVGSSLVGVDHDQIKSRRIDLVGGRADFLSAALPHELTHVVLKDRFISTSIPRWADEGTAILADTRAKQGRHRNDLTDAFHRHATFAAASLITMEDYPGPDRMGAFYGQSVSLAEFLIDRKRPSRFVEFIELAGTEGYDAALRQCYGIANVDELDHQWRAYVASGATAKSTATPNSLASAR